MNLELPCHNRTEQQIYRMRSMTLVFALLLPVAADAQDLQQVYRDAKSYDAQYASARYALQAGLEKLPQGRALILPSLNLSASTNNQHIDSHSDTPGVADFIRNARSYGYTLSLSQPLYRPQNVASYDQAEYQVKQAEGTFGQASQDLILRVAQAYFDVLAAQDTLALVRAQKAALSKQLAQAKRNFEVGTATITDTHEAQARFDLAVAQEISAQNDLDTKYRAVQQITGKEYGALKALRGEVKLSPPAPNNMTTWVDLAEKQSYPVLIQEATQAIAALEAKKQSAGHLPTLDFVASYGYTGQTASQITPFASTFNATAFGLQFGMPLYQGGAISSREREAAANLQKATEDLENARRAS